MKKYKIVVWGTGREYSKYVGFLKRAEALGECEVLGVTSDDTWLKSYDGWPFLAKDELLQAGADAYLITSEAAAGSMTKEAQAMGIPLEKIWHARVLFLPGFTFEKYAELRESRPSIVAMYCWGGYTYHWFSMPFYSPFINLWLKEDDFLTMLENLHHYLAQPLVRAGTEWYSGSDKLYPVMSTGGVHLHMNHYLSEEDGRRKWNERLQRFNWDNIVVMMSTEDEAIARRFDALPYQKKVCFMPFERDIPSVFTPETCGKVELHKREVFDFYVNRMADGRYPYYDPWELVMHGKFVKRMELA